MDVWFEVKSIKVKFYSAPKFLCIMYNFYILNETKKTIVLSHLFITFLELNILAVSVLHVVLYIADFVQ